MTISVIIATYNRAALLAECLDHLAQQDFQPGDQVVIVDNGSTDRTPSVIADARLRFPVALIQLEETVPGKSRAIARALEVATGDVLAFTDDDVDVDPEWLDAIRRAMVANPATALVGGPVAPRWERSAPAWLRAAAHSYGRLAAPLALLNYGPDTSELGPRTLLGANLAVRRDVFAQAGGFAPHLGKLRGTLLSGEDHDLCRRVQAAGFRAAYEPSIRVRHWVPAERMRARYHVSWFFWSGITHAAFDADRQRSGRTLLGVPLYLVRRMTTSGIAAVAATARGNLAGAMERLTDVAFAAGYASGSWRLPPTILVATPIARRP